MHVRNRRYSYFWLISSTVKLEAQKGDKAIPPSMVADVWVGIVPPRVQAAQSFAMSNALTIQSMHGYCATGVKVAHQEWVASWIVLPKLVSYDYRGSRKIDEGQIVLTIKQSMNVLIVGSGAREHALARTCAKSSSIGNLFVAPGNPGCALVAETVALNVADHAEVIDFCQEQNIDLVVVGPEAPLVAGLADDLMDAGILCCGPSRKAAQLEGSKGYAKEFCIEFGIPTSDFRRFRDQDEAKAYIRGCRVPIVVKADGLAAGKGVIVAMTLNDAEAAVEMLLSNTLGPAGAEIVVEEFLEGVEVSFFALCDGEIAIPFESAQDYKRVGEGDKGPNTGGMGAYSPSAIMTPELSQRIMREIVRPTLKGMNKRGSPFRGVLFAGLMVGESGPKLIEFNVRFGDPEAEVILPRLKDDLLPLLVGCASGTLRKGPLQFSSDIAVAVVMAARGYPGEPLRGSQIEWVEENEPQAEVVVFHGGTRAVGDAIFAEGGRSLTITALGREIAEARERAYAAIDRINWPEGFFRRDIGLRVTTRDSKE
jgi:phosphoribosylamine---glycine ligase